MRLSSVLLREAITDELVSCERDGVLAEMVDALVAAGAVEKNDCEDLLKTLMRREKLGTTGIGKGIAIPHAKHDGVEGIIAAVGHSKTGIDFASLDGGAVHTVFLILANPSATGEHLAVLERISAIVRDIDYWRFLKNARDSREILEIIAEADDRFDA